MELKPGRVLRLSVDASASTIVPISSAREIPEARVVPEIVVDAAEKAGDLIRGAEDRAAQIIAEAERQASDAREHAAREGRAQGAAELGARWIQLRAEEAARDERDLSRSVELARIMAERLIGASLEIHPETVIHLARQALTQARQARRVAIDAHPDDAAVLERHAAELGLEGGAIAIHVDAGRMRGSLRLRTDLGTLDADLAPQLDRLAAALRATLHGR